MGALFSGRDLGNMSVMKINFNMYFLKEWVLKLKKRETIRDIETGDVY